jgi:putative tryptophan/tyrosine transport system substrate-binding protein
MGSSVIRRDFITLVGGAAVAWPFAAMAQEPGRTYRLGVVTASPRNIPAFVSMIDELRRFGFVEGQNFTIEWRS